MQDFGGLAGAAGGIGQSYIAGEQAGTQVAAQRQHSAIEQMQAESQQKQDQISNVASMMKLFQPAVQEAAKRGGQAEVDKVMTSFRSNPIFQSALKLLGIDPNNMVVQVDEDKIPKNGYRTQVTPELKKQLDEQGITLSPDQTSVSVFQSPDGTLQYAPDKDNLSPLDIRGKEADINYKNAAAQNQINQGKKAITPKPPAGPRESAVTRNKIVAAAEKQQAYDRDNGLPVKSLDYYIAQKKKEVEKGFGESPSLPTVDMSIPSTKKQSPKIEGNNIVIKGKKLPIVKSMGKRGVVINGKFNPINELN